MVMGEPVPVDSGGAAALRARRASILDPATLPDVRFYHHLLAGIFCRPRAAAPLQRRGRSLQLWKSTAPVEEMPPAGEGGWDPLPEPPTTGWEVTTILACGLARQPAKLIEAVRQVNPVPGRALPGSKPGSAAASRRTRFGSRPRGPAGRPYDPGITCAPACRPVCFRPHWRPALPSARN